MGIIRSLTDLEDLGRLELPQDIAARFHAEAAAALREQGPLVVLAGGPTVLFTPLRPLPGRPRVFYFGAGPI